MHLLQPKPLAPLQRAISISSIPPVVPERAHDACRPTRRRERIPEVGRTALGGGTFPVRSPLSRERLAVEGRWGSRATVAEWGWAEERKSEKGGGQMSSSKSKGVACRVGIQRASASLQGRLVSSTTTMSTTTMSAINSSFPARSPPLIQAGQTVLSPSLQRERIKHHSRPPRRGSRIKGGCSAGAGEMRVGGSWTALVLDRAGLRRDVAVRDTKANEEEDEKEERERARARARARVERANEFFWSAPVGSLEGASSSPTARR